MFEIKITGLDHLADAIFALAAAMTQSKGPAPEASQQAPAPATPAAQAPMTSVPDQEAPVQNPATTVPTAPVAQTYTMEQLGVAMTGLVDSGKLEIANQILGKFGAQTLMQVPPEYYPQLATAMREAGAVI